MKSESIERLKNVALQMRIDAMKMAYSCGPRGAHIGGSLSCIELYAALYGSILHLPKEAWGERDRFIAGKEHARLAEFPAMKAAGLISEEEMYSFEDDGSLLAGHTRRIERGLEYCSCSLGMALSIAVGKALSAKMSEKQHRVICLLGDGECGEGAVWEAIMTAAKYNLGNLTLIIDKNNMSVDGFTEDVLPMGDLEKKLTAFGWKAVTIDGHNFNEILSAFEISHSQTPLAIVANTVKGKGVPFMENQKQWHQAELGEIDYQKALASLKSGELS